MTHLSDKELLKKMKELPSYELNEEQKTRIIKAILEKKSPRRRFGFSFQRAGVLGALFALMLIVPVLFLENMELPETNSSEGVEKAEIGEYFALFNEAGKQIYLDSNFGIPGKVSLLLPVELVAEDYRGISKIMVYLWGNPDDLVNKDMKIEGVHVDSGITQEMASFTLSNGMNGSDAHALTSFKPFEKQGYWNLKLINKEGTFGDFSVYVKEPYVEIGKATLMISKEDLVAETFEDVNLEVEGEDLPEQVKLRLFSLEDGTTEVFTFSDRMDFIKSAKKVSIFTGDIVLKKSGKYRITVLNQSVPVEVRESGPPANQ
ncbi:hypothetical protein [Lederbergia citri]|uniref:Uncharacterized protein n=1 Tax=Lederbergia citri TaxID=2833580 RepID=A0A942TCY1_9BACI|nr:hypothetical protein [Lederbergia citri]MBS4194184.1 hypothetical protein [Lederbergia citri]